MKKLLSVFLVLLVVGGMAFGEPAVQDSTTLVLNSTVAANYGIKILSADLETKNVGTFNAAAATANVNFTDEVQAASLYVAMKSNTKAAYKVKVTALPLSSLTVTTKIGYTVAATGETAVDVASNSEGSNIVLASFPLVNGMRVVTNAFTITIDDVEWLAAGQATDYTTTWTVNLETQ